MNKTKRLLFFSLLPLLVACGTNVEEDSSSSSSEERQKERVSNVNLALSDFEHSLSNYFKHPNQGISFADKEEGKPFVSAAFSSERAFEEPLSSSTVPDDSLYAYQLDLSCEDFRFSFLSLDDSGLFSAKVGSSDIYIDIQEIDGSLDLSFKQGVLSYFASVDDSSGLYLDLSKAALTRSFLETVYPDLSLKERSYIDLTSSYKAISSFFPLNGRLSSFVPSLRKKVQEGLDGDKAAFYAYPDEETTYLEASYDDVDSFKEEARTAIDLLLEGEEGKETKEKALSFIDSIESLSLEFEYAFTFDDPLYVTIEGDISFKKEETSSGLSSLSLATKGRFLSEEEASFELPKNLGDRSIWLTE